MTSPTPEQIIALLRHPLEPAHGAWAVYNNVQGALATLIEQNETIIAELQLLTAPPESGKK